MNKFVKVSTLFSIYFSIVFFSVAEMFSFKMDNPLYWVLICVNCILIFLTPVVIVMGVKKLKKKH